MQVMRMYACAYVVTENKFRKALVLSLPLQSLLAVGWVVLELCVVIHSIRLAEGR